MSETPLRKLIEDLRRMRQRVMGADVETVNDAIDAIERAHQQERPFALQLALLLDASIPALEKAAAAERRREDGKSLRCITDQERLKAVEEAVAKADKLFGSIS